MRNKVKNKGMVLESAEKLCLKHLDDRATKVLQIIPEDGRSVL